MRTDRKAREGPAPISCQNRALPGGHCGGLFVLVLASLALVTSILVPTTAGAQASPLTITTTALPTGEVGVADLQRLTASGGTSPYRFSTSSPLPSGLTFSSGGTLSGTPQAAADESLSIAVTDAAGATATASLSLVIESPLAITSTALPTPGVGEGYATTLAASGGSPPYSWSVTGGPLPLGLLLNSSGLLSGLPAAVGMTATTFTVTDALSGRASATLSLEVAASVVAPASYLLATSAGAVSAYASPGIDVAQTGQDDPQGIVALATDGAGDHYWLVSATGLVTPSPGTRSYGSVGKGRLSGHVVGIAALPQGNGYFIVSSTGAVYGFGAAHSFGERRSRRFSGEIVGVAVTPTGSGYWVATSTGHVYAFGAAPVLRRHGHGSLANVVAITADPLGNGYWLVNRAGRVFPFGAAPTEGSVPGGKRLRSVVGIAATPDGAGYWVVNGGGALWSFGDAPLLAPVEVGPRAGHVVGIAGAQ